MSRKTEDFIDSFIEWLVDSEDEGEVVSKLKGELNAVGFEPSDELVALVTPEDFTAVVAEDEEEVEEEEEEDETEGYWGEDEDEEDDED